MKLDIVFLFFLLLLCISLSISLKTGTIYKLQCQITEKNYIGRTTIGIDKAMKRNIKLLKEYKRGILQKELSLVEVMTNQDYNVTILEEIYGPANDTDFSLTLRKRQRFYVEKYDNSVNKVIPSRTKKEYDTVNRDRFSQYRKQYNKDNKIAVRLRCKENYERAKSIKLTCKICNKEYLKSSLSKHN